MMMSAAEGSEGLRRVRSEENYHRASVEDAAEQRTRLIEIGSKQITY